MHLGTNKILQNEQELSSEVRELITNRLPWPIRNGNGIFLFVILIFLTITWFIRYPDIIYGTMRLEAINAPKLLIAKTGGKLQKLMVLNEQAVKQGQPLAYLESTANYHQVIHLFALIEDIKPYIATDSFDILLNIQFPTFDQLGEIQPTYQDFKNALDETMQIFPDGYYEKRKRALQKDLSYLFDLRNNVQRLRHLAMEDYDLQKIRYGASESLAKDKVVAALELNDDKSKVISKEQFLAQISTQNINNNISEQNKRKEVLNLKKYVKDQKQKFRSSLFNLKSKIDEWMKQYVVTAPENGKVLFASFLQENQLIENGQELFYLQPPQSEYYGVMKASQTGLGKIEIGQKVFIRVKSYPSDEFGYLTGSVDYISNIPTQEDSFLIKIGLPKELRSNYNKIIYFRNDLIAQAEVVTDNRRLIGRFLGRLKEVFNR